MMWFFSAVLAVLCFGGMQLCFRYLSGAGVSTQVFLLLIFVLITAFLGLHVLLTRSSVVIERKLLLVVFGAAVLSYFGNLLMVRAMDLAPNPGYAIAVIGAQAIVVTIGSIALFGSGVSSLHGVGIVLSIVGVALLAVAR